jgi:trans-2,3-dihydro-3-hydroxyanthranilate isomerase
MTSVGAETKFHIIDVFADEPLTGNPLAVVPDADALGEALMRRIAREFNQSETTFLLRPTRPEADHRLRSFTPTGDEVFGAGHNALGAWWWLAEAGRLGALSNGVRAKQEIGRSVLPVDIAAAGGSLTMIGLTQGRPAILATHDNPSLLAAALALDVHDVAAGAARPQVVSTGAPHLLVQATSRAAVDRARPNAAVLLQELKSIGATSFASTQSRQPPRPMRASSIRPSGFGRIRPRAALPVPSPGTSRRADSWLPARS